MNLLHRRNHVIAMFDHIVGEHLAELTVGKRSGALVQIMGDVWIYTGRYVHIECVVHALST